jgi:peptide/nickel transport system substrate-binding protein
MTRSRTTASAAAVTAAALVLSACGGGKKADNADPDPSASATGSTGGVAEPVAAAAFNAGVDKVFNPSTTKGGTLRMANVGDWDSLDPADTYFAYSWNFVRLYGRTLVTFDAKPGAGSAKLVPDLATSLGKPSADAKTWTYKLRKGVKFEDGTAITSKDVKYAVERSLDKKTFPNGPTYFNDFLDLNGYTSPYDDTSSDKLGLKAIQTPDDQTIVFKLKQPFSGFDYFAQLPATIPVPQGKDTGAKYKDHVVSSGPYKFAENNPGKNFTLVRNEAWDASSDPIRTALPDRIEVALNVNADDIDNRLIAGDLDLDVVGGGVQAAAQGRILGDKKLKRNADNAAVSRTWFSVLNSNVAPFDNLHCRKAVEYATDKLAYQNAYGGPPGGDIATGLLPPLIPGAEKFDLYEAAAQPKGDVTKAKDELKACGKPDGFSTNASYRIERPKEKATAEALQQALDRVGIKLTLKSYPQGDYAKLYAGKPDFVKKENLGIIIYGWGADWPDGFGFLQQIVDSRAIRDTGGNTNLGIVSKAVDTLLDDALKQTDTAKREKLWAQIDRKVMEEAQALPGVWAKGLFFRPPSLTNVFISNGYQMYDYVTLGVKK